MRLDFIRDVLLYSLGSKRYYSHPGRLLREHLTGVADKGISLLASSGLDRLGICSEKDILDVSLAHDLGKMHPDTVRFFSSPDKGGRSKIPPHSLVGAVVALISGADPWVAEIIRRHHGGIVNTDAAKEFWMDRYGELAYENVLARLGEYFPDFPLDLTEKEWDIVQNSVFLNLQPSPESWVRVRNITSLFITADRMDAAGVDTFDLSPIPEFTKPTYIHAKETPLDAWRAGLHDVCIENAEQIKHPGLYSITLPTGAGKTNIGIECASIIAKNLKAKRIIYALPFISIVDQNYSRTVEMMGEDLVQPDHSQRPPEIDRIGEEVIPIKKHVNQYRFWDRPVVVTTMAHLWDILFSPAMRRVQNFHALANSVVILDEPQTIPSKYWAGLESVTQFLSSRLHTTFVFMTATQPAFTLSVPSIAPPLVKPLAPRWRLDFIRPLDDREGYYIEEIPELIQTHLGRLAKGDSSSGLVSLNTKRAALAAYGNICRRINKEDVFFLSGWMVHANRSPVMEEIIRREKSDERRILVATQVIEAGADLDFNWVFSDLKPLTSLVQILGRLNRHMTRSDLGQALTTVLLDAENNDRSYASYVYDTSIDLATTRRILSDNCPFTESDMESLVNYYHHELGLKKRSVPIWDMICRGHWADIPGLIEDNYDEYTVYVEYSDEVISHIEKLQDKKWCRENPGKFRWRSRDLQQYEIKVSPKQLESWLNSAEGINTGGKYIEEITPGESFLITKKAFGSVYSTRVGFMPYAEARALGVLDNRRLQQFHSTKLPPASKTTRPIESFWWKSIFSMIRRTPVTDWWSGLRGHIGGKFPFPTLRKHFKSGRERSRQ